MRVLIVEDDQHLTESLAFGLGESGYAVDAARTGNEALASLQVVPVDLIVLDVMLPGGVDGFEVARRVRRAGLETPILMLTARDAIEERVRGLEAGADDYLTKPFAFEELLARIRALMRRDRGLHTQVIESGNLRLDSAARRVIVEDREVEVTNKEYAILELFMLHPGRVLSQRQIRDLVWDFSFNGESNIVEVYVGRIRRKLITARATGQLTTVRGAGYRYDGPTT